MCIVVCAAGNDAKDQLEVLSMAKYLKVKLYLLFQSHYSNVKGFTVTKGYKHVVTIIPLNCQFKK